MTTETPEEKIKRLKLEHDCRDIGKALVKEMPDGVGFCLLMLTYGDNGATAYISNIRRDDMLKALREFLEKV